MLVETADVSRVDGDETKVELDGSMDGSVKNKPRLMTPPAKKRLSSPAGQES